MDLSDPTRAVTPTLDGPVLAVLGATGRPLTIGEIASRAVRGSEIGIRRSVARLVEQGLVRATVMGRNSVHELNRDHIAAGVALALADLRLELWRRLREELSSWSPAPVYAAAFGSAARADGGPDSDVDVLLVHAPFPGERASRKAGRHADRWAAVLRDLAADATSATGIADEVQWEVQVDDLRGLVQRWTGNVVQVIDLSVFDWLEPPSSMQPLVAAIQREGIELARSVTLPLSVP